MKLKIAVCDPIINIKYPLYGPIQHNDAGIVSYDIYDVNLDSPFPNWNTWTINYPSSLTAVVDTSIRVFENYPPEIPQIKGPPSGRMGEELTYNFSSSDNHDSIIYFKIDWGDGNISDWIRSFKGNSITLAHKWQIEGNFTISAKAKDKLGLESDWGFLEVSMPKQRNINIIENIIAWLKEGFPFLQPCLSQII